MKKTIAILLTLFFTLSWVTGCGSPADNQATEPATLHIGALKGPTAMGMVKLMDDAQNDRIGEDTYEFSISASIDDIPPALLQGRLDIAAVPANLASVLYNNTDGQIQVLAINTLGVLYIVENGSSISGIDDLKGKTIYASGKGATPEYALNYILLNNGINPQKDVTIEWKSEHTECVAAIATDPQAVAMLPQPFVTTAQLKNDQIRIALDLTREWDLVQEREDSDSADSSASALITGVLVVRKAFAEENPEAIRTFLDRYESSVTFVRDNTEAAAELIGAFDIVPANVAALALPYCNITFIEGTDMQTQLSGYLQVLYDHNPKSIGGALPLDDFYYQR